MIENIHSKIIFWKSFNKFFMKVIIVCFSKCNQQMESYIDSLLSDDGYIFFWIARKWEM